MARKAKNVAPKKLHIKKGDKVMVIAGSSKGKTGEVLEVFQRNTEQLLRM